jgi:hypothetical protein
MLKPTDEVSFGLMSKLPGCNVSEPEQASKETEQIGFTYGIPRQSSTLHSSQKRWQEPFSILSRRQRRRAGEVLNNSINSHGVF